MQPMVGFLKAPRIAKGFVEDKLISNMFRMHSLFERIAINAYRSASSIIFCFSRVCEFFRRQYVGGCVLTATHHIMQVSRCRSYRSNSSVCIVGGMGVKCPGVRPCSASLSSTNTKSTSMNSSVEIMDSNSDCQHVCI